MDQGSSLNFDFNSQAGVMSLLAAIRSSALGPVEKNELRDLVFLYTNGGGDVSVRIALEQKLVAHKIQPVVSAVPTASTSPAPVLSFGSSRPAPVFKDVSNQISAPVATPVSAPQVAQTTVTPPVYAQMPSPVAVQQPAPVPPPVQQPVASVPVQQVPVTAPVYVQPQVPVQSPVLEPVPVQQVPVVAQAPVMPIPVATPVSVQPVPVQSAPVAQAPIVQPSPAPAPVGVNYLDRIREIKSAVNSKVGNPVNLVDINNEVGREYMNALLDAMKKLSGGATSQVEAAMQRLESAYQAVEVAVTAHNQAKTVATEPTIPTPVPAPIPVTEVSVPVNPNSVLQQPVETPVSPVNSPIVGSWSQPDTQVASAVTQPEPAVVEPLSVFKLSPEEQNISGFNTLPVPEPEVSTPVNEPVAPALAQVPIPPTISSLADEQKIRTPQDLPTADSLATSASGDPLNTREVDDGLEQLLSDWALFKKSGLFGTGPRGREHPLFKKIAGLQIPLVLAGRFEGSTQEIKQSITDYMNGWRYEQGIIYEQGETFEHYLRRVIKQILDLQKKRKPA